MTKAERTIHLDKRNLAHSYMSSRLEGAKMENNWNVKRDKIDCLSVNTTFDYPGSQVGMPIAYAFGMQHFFASYCSRCLVLA